MSYTGAHPPDHVLAELAEGVLDAHDAAGVREHTSTCQACSVTLDRLAHVTRALREAPAEISMPAHVSARIGAALTAEAAASTAEAAGGAATAGATSSAATTDEHDAVIVPFDDRPVAWFRKRLPQLVAAAAAAAVVGFAGYAVFSDNDPSVPAAGQNPDDAAESAEMTAADEDEDYAGDAADEDLDDDAPRLADAPERDGDDNISAEDEDLLADIALDIWATGSEVSPGCGDILADDLQYPLVGSAEVADEVLVVFADGGELFGWMLPDCESGPTTGEPVVAVPEPQD
ncbi:hypothetical protein [Phytoactinopolyspora limicola]|uniref:hypothetical protein n=1 Tax=Phytoactinopolyspora limicola TaxID=2715536 RepID=UPI001409650B|nr:hypothetical protein [Phytoactinopolyspora limicola]